MKKYFMIDQNKQNWDEVHVLETSEFQPTSAFQLAKPLARHVKETDLAIEEKTKQINDDYLYIGGTHV